MGRLDAAATTWIVRDLSSPRESPRPSLNGPGRSRGADAIVSEGDPCRSHDVRGKTLPRRLCSWAEDGNTMRRICHVDRYGAPSPRSCVPGCVGTVAGRLPGKNRVAPPPAHHFLQSRKPLGPFPRADLGKMLAAQDAVESPKHCHNEIVLSKECWAQHLPELVPAWAV